MGRKRQYNRERIMTAICGIISSSDKGLDDVCHSKDYFPTARTVAQWLSEDASLSQMYARAKAAQADFIADQIRKIADECRIGEKVTVKETKDGTFTETVRADMVERARLQIDARKWLAAKLAPNKYGEKSQITANVNVEHSIGGIIDSVMGHTKPLVALDAETVEALPQGQEPCPLITVTAAQAMNLPIR